VAALRRVCLDNTLFLPSFPISDMNDLEIEEAAMGPHRWIELCGAFEKQNHAILYPRSTRIINDSFPTEVNYEISLFFLVPGGRYLVCYSAAGVSNTVSVLDLGCTSSPDCKLIASVGVDIVIAAHLKVQTTPDGMGLIIFMTNRSM
jgi:hypothetical protein